MLPSLFPLPLTEFEPIPLPCDLVQCPAEADMQCPEDSAIREEREIKAVNLTFSNAVAAMTTTEMATTIWGSNSSDSSDNNNGFSSHVPDWQFAQCCLAKKCICKTCYIPDCEDGEFVVELEPENMDTPGQCCGQYECKPEPNCAEVWDTDYYWLQRCRRCNCQKGERICQQSCEEHADAYCESKRDNQLYKSGQTWVEGCYQCECVRGEPKCVIPFCSHVDCPSERQVTLKDDCCPVCWPKGEPMPHEKLRPEDDQAEDYGFAGNHSSSIIDTTTSSSTSSTTSTSTTSSPTTPAPCQEFPKVVNVVQPSNNITEICSRITIVILVLIIAVLFIYIRHLRAKQRYKPVSKFDENI